MEDWSDKLLGISLAFLVIAVTAIVMGIETQAYASGNDDSNTKEIGLEWVENYAGTGFCNLTYSQEDAKGFWNVLGNYGFSNVFNHGNDAAWEKYWENTSVGGIDNNVIDTVDFVYFAGHGTNVSLRFRQNRDGDGYYTNQTHYSEVDWGDKDLEWVFISACNVLQRYPSQWDAAFHTPKTLHGITGFNSDMIDTNLLGTYFARYLSGEYGGRGPQCILDAWQSATKLDWHQAYKSAAIYAVVFVCPPQPNIHYWNEYLPGFGSGMNPDPSIPQPGMTISIEYWSWECK